MSSAASWYGLDCSAGGWAIVDPGCIIANAGTSIGTAVNNATAPLVAEINTLLYVIIAAVIVIVLIIGFAPNVKHVVPHFV